MYAFYEPTPVIQQVTSRKWEGARRVLVFRCANKGKCNQRVQRFMDSADKSLTGNMGKHASHCWGDAAFAAGKVLGKVETLRQVVNVVKRTGKLAQSFDIKHAGKPTYSNIGHTRPEIR